MMWKLSNIQKMLVEMQHNVFNDSKDDVEKGEKNGREDSYPSIEEIPEMKEEEWPSKSVSRA